MTEETFNPLDKKNLGISVAEALLAKQPIPLPPTESFNGAGIYVIYYTGRFSPYKKIAERNRGGKFDAPIYIGKAIPAGGRKGILDPNAKAGPVLFKRLSEHAESIRQASDTLKLEDFFCRYLLVDDIWIPLGESLLIQKFAPLWNRVIDGFGNHDPGVGRYSGQCPAWDIVHPGRFWAPKCKKNPRSQPEWIEDIRKALDGH
jgi:hypothetical protein